MYWIESSHTDPTWNLAMEEYLFSWLPGGTACLFLWQNDRSVIVGKNQNTIQEVNSAFVHSHQIPVVRRLSGGGAVWHDLGNLNFTIICDGPETGEIDLKRFCEPIVQVLLQNGVPAKINGRNDITAEGKKVSGNAQYLRNGRLLHHGTLLLRSDLAMLEQALRVNREKIRSKGIVSVSDRVENLCRWLPPELTLTQLKEQLRSQFGAAEQLLLPETASEEIRQLQKEKYAAWEWNYGASPSGTIQNSCYFPDCGSIEMQCRMEHGCIREIRFYGDYFSAADPAALEKQLLGCPFRRDTLASKLKEIETGHFFEGITLEQLLGLIIPE